MCREVYVTMRGRMADVRDFEDFHMPRPFDVLRRRQEQATFPAGQSIEGTVRP